ncbi:MAG: hypothetical protein K2P93_01065 [Alphaproteobacteria bacterium]|nr:hypothetical protein [Alphaproteobacteria bacterium]
MKRYLTLLTLSFLSTSTLVEAGKINIFDLPKDPDERRASLIAKAKKLEQNIDGTQGENLKKAFTTMRLVINNLTRVTELSQDDAENYIEASELKTTIVADFLKRAHYREFDGQFDTIERILQSGIYTEKSQEFEDLQRAMQSSRELFSYYNGEPEKLKAAARYLKMEKIVNRIVQNANEIIADVMTEAELRRKSNLLEELTDIREMLPYKNENYELVDKAFWSMRTIQESTIEGDIIQAVLEYRGLKEKLEPFLLKHRGLKQETPSYVSSILSGNYTELERGLSSLRFEYGTPEHEAIRDFFRLIGQVKELPGLLSRFKEVEPKVQAILSASQSLGDTFAQPCSSSGLQPESYIDFFDHDDIAFRQAYEAPRENIANSVFKLNHEFESISGNPPAPKGYQFVADPEQKARKHGPKVVAQKYPGRVAITGDGYVLYSQLPAAEMKKLHDQKFRFEVEMKSTTPGAYVQYWGFKKGSEKLKSAPHIGNGKWLTLSVDFTIDKEATQYLIYPAIMPAVPSNSEAPVVKVRNVRITQL